MKAALCLFVGVFSLGCYPATPPAPLVPDTTTYLQQLRADVQRVGSCRQDLACYADLSLPDTGYRFFVLDLVHGRVLHRGVCLNGRTDEQGHVRYSNEVGSNCSSRGLARIGAAYEGFFGRAYRLHGLDAGTTNLFRRTVVLHSWEGLAAEPSSEKPIQSEGCPTLNPQFLDTVATYLDHSARPVLLRLN